jgi:uncharacterized membrane protein
MRAFVTLLLGVLTVLYPVAVYLSLEYFSPRLWGGILLGLFALRLWIHRRQRMGDLAVWVSVAASLAALWMLAGDSPTALRSYPVMVNATLAVVFAVSLLRPPTMIERLARLQDPALPPEGIPYTRKVTWVWLAFFLVNGAIASYTAYWGTLEQWTLYNGIISYVLMGLLFAGEWCVRQSVIKRVQS